MFEKPAIMFDARTDEIVQSVRELSRLDHEYETLPSPAPCLWVDGSCVAFIRMFLSRTVAAEICMEAKTNEPAYTALKRLDKDGILRFELSYVTALSRVR